MASTRPTLGGFLRTRRERLTALDGGARARRTPGLRREEIAERAGVSVDWYVRLEQNRAGSVSASVLDRVSRALELGRDERTYLYRLAGRSATAAPLTPAAQAASSAARAVLQNIAAAPACVLGPRLDVLEANAPYRALFLGLGNHAELGHNMVWFVCCDPRAQHLLLDHDALVADATGALRAAFARHLDDPAFLELISELSRSSPAFVDHWAAQRVRERVSGRKRFRHPVAGALDFDFHAVAPCDAPDQLLAVYAARDARTRAAVETGAIRMRRRSPTE